MSEEGRVRPLRHFEILSLNSGPRENVEWSQVLKCNFLMSKLKSSSVATFDINKQTNRICK